MGHVSADGCMAEMEYENCLYCMEDEFRKVEFTSHLVLDPTRGDSGNPKVESTLTLRYELNKEVHRSGACEHVSASTCSKDPVAEAGGLALMI
nr:hypothetical protein HmN_000984300 [Hymenolepis microstoma]CUU98155.1 hypothetical transcript [Hymenolepis microstoma]